MDTNRHYIQFAFDVFKWLQTQPLLGNFPLARLEIIQTDTGKLFGEAGWYGISLYIDNIIEKSMGYPMPEKYHNDPKKMVVFIDKFIRYNIIETLIHEAHHLYLPTDYDEYQINEDYRNSIEDTVDYNTHIFIINYYKTLESLFGKLVITTAYNYDHMNDIIKRNAYIRLINPNDFSLLYNMCCNFGCPIEMCMTTALTKDITVVIDIDGDIKSHIVRMNYYVDYFWVNTLNDRLIGKKIYEMTGEFDKNKKLIVTLKGKSDLYKPYKFVPYRRNIQY